MRLVRFELTTPILKEWCIYHLSYRRDCESQRPIFQTAVIVFVYILNALSFSFFYEPLPEFESEFSTYQVDVLSQLDDKGINYFRAYDRLRPGDLQFTRLPL